MRPASRHILRIARRFLAAPAPAGVKIRGSNTKRCGAFRKERTILPETTHFNHDPPSYYYPLSPAPHSDRSGHSAPRRASVSQERSPARPRRRKLARSGSLASQSGNAHDSFSSPPQTGPTASGSLRDSVGSAYPGGLTPASTCGGAFATQPTQDVPYRNDVWTLSVKVAARGTGSNLTVAHKDGLRGQ